ncbi:MAG: HAD family hydrolase [Planctomycetota bacterium]
MKRKLVLFDIDGTLLSAKGAARPVVLETLREFFGVTGVWEGYAFAGKTDPQIFRELARAAGVSEAQLAATLPAALTEYARRLEARLEPQHVVLKPGTRELLAALSCQSAVTVGLLTGNLEPCARTKLRHPGIDHHFALGAYGSDDADRYRLPPVALARATAATGYRFTGPETVIIGDSIHDVRCGRTLGVRSVAVLTGPTPRAELEREHPAAILDDFGDLECALRAILD